MRLFDHWLYLVVLGVVGSPTDLYADFPNAHDSNNASTQHGRFTVEQSNRPSDILPSSIDNRSKHSTSVVTPGNSSHVESAGYEIPVNRVPQQSTNGRPTPLKLSPPSDRKSNSSNPKKPPTISSALGAVISSLSIVLGLLLLVVWFTRRAMPAAAVNLPKDAIEVLGRAPLGNRQQMQLVRLGKKLLLLSVTATGAKTLTEITESEEVDRLVGICQQNRPDSITTTFRQVIAGLGNEPADELMNPEYANQQDSADLISQQSAASFPSSKA